MRRTLSQRKTSCTPFASTAPELVNAGLSPVPCGGSDGKRPLVRWRNLRGVGPGLLGKWLPQFGSENVGILTGQRSNVSIVDIDDPTLMHEILARCGESPIITRTPRGGAHFWYRWNGERSVTGLDRLAVDVRGEGGFVVIPPSVRPDTGTAYAFERGSWADLARLPQASPGILPLANDPVENATWSADPAGLRAVREGRRNDTLFRHLLREVKGCDDFDALLDCAHTRNSDFLPPLPDAEIFKTAKSVWDIEAKGRNWVGRERRATITASEFDALADDICALRLLLKLHLEHGGRREPFAVACKAMAESRCIPGMTNPNRIRRAREKLIRLGSLERVHKGGSRDGDTDLFRLPD